MAGIQLPNNWTPRNYQIPVFAALDSGIRRVITVWHRRSGKDSAAINYISKAAHKRIGGYWHLFPTAKQARKALWENVDKQGRRTIDQAVPPELRESTRQDEMFIRLKSGSTIQVAGADQFDGLVGSNPVGVVFSEYALTSPLTWRYVAPILRENGGWAWFNSTPRGKNHLYDLVETNKNNPRWLISIKGWRDTGILTQQDIDEEIRDGMPIEVAEQEFNCSFSAPNVGLVYGKQMEQVRRDNRILPLPYDMRFPVETWWDIGKRDATSIWFVQRIGQWINVIDHYEKSGQGLPHFANQINAKGYYYSRHIGPHDLENGVWAIDTTTRMVAQQNFGINFTVAPKLAISEGIGALRMLFSRLRFDTEKTAYLRSALEQYQYEWDEEKRLFTDKPLHDWSSHAADAGRYGAVTPAEIGVVPQWAKDLLDGGSFPVPQITKMGRIGHNGGPPMDEAYDPLSAFR